jgi:hypothetical protein
LDDLLGPQEDINAARACVYAAVREGNDVRLEGPAEDAFLYLEAATDCLRRGDLTEGRREIADAVYQLRAHIDLPVAQRSREELSKAIGILTGVLNDLG